jgi:rubredoxin
MLLLINNNWRSYYIMTEHICIVCGHVHNEELEGKWEDLGDEFLCPECGCGKQDYDTVTL